MANKCLSLGRLINLKALNQLIKKADSLIIGMDSGMTYICNSHWVVRIHLAEDSATRTEIFKRLGRIPEDGKALSAPRRAGDSASDFDLDKLKSFAGKTFYASCHDTKLSAELTDGNEVRLFECKDDGERCYIAIARHYFDMIAEYARAATEKCSARNPILFTGDYDEFALILPVNYCELPYLK